MSEFSDRLLRRLPLALIALIAGVVVVWAAWSYLHPEQTVLFSGLTEADAAKVITELEERDVRHGIIEGGSAITVPADDVDRLRLKLHESGLAFGGSSGFELFDDADFGMTEFVQRVNYQRALEGELSRTVSALDEVKQARVHLVIPERALFETNGDVPTASVILFSAMNREVSRTTVTGIQKLVAASVPGLTPPGVVVSNYRSVTLQGILDEEDDAATAMTALDHKKEFERYLATKLQAVLTPIAGYRNVFVAVDASIDMDAETLHEERPLLLENGEPAVTQRRETRRADERRPESNSDTTTTETSYIHGKRQREVEFARGRITRLSIAVLVPSDLDESLVDALRDVAGAAAGVDVQRGDVLTVGHYDESVAAAPAVKDVILSAPNGMNELTDTAPLQADITGGSTIGVNAATAVGLAIFILLALLGSVLLRKRSSPESLTPEEREQALNTLNRWLSGEPEPATDG